MSEIAEEPQQPLVYRRLVCRFRVSKVSTVDQIMISVHQCRLGLKPCLTTLPVSSITVRALAYSTSSSQVSGGQFLNLLSKWALVEQNGVAAVEGNAQEFVLVVAVGQQTWNEVVEGFRIIFQIWVRSSRAPVAQTRLLPHGALINAGGLRAAMEARNLPQIVIGSLNCRSTTISDWLLLKLFTIVPEPLR